MSMLSTNELEKLSAAESLFPSPIPVQSVSSDEFMPGLQTKKQREFETRVKEMGARMAKRLGMNQSAIARLEAAEHNPSFETLCRLSSTLGIEFLVDIAPSGKRRRWVNKNAEQSGETIDVEGSQVLIAAAS